MRGDDAATGPAAAAQPLFPIRVVARLTGINPVTIRAWERRYGLVSPQRTPGGHRLYSRADVDRLRSAVRLTARGLPISQASRLLDGDGSEQGSNPKEALDGLMTGAGGLDDESMTALYEALRARADGGEAASALLSGLVARLEPLPAVQHRFIEAWLSALVGARLQASLPDENAVRVIVCAGGDGAGRAWASALAVLLCEAGLRPILLGPVPTEDLITAANEAGFAGVVLAGSGDGGSPLHTTFFRGPFGPAKDGSPTPLDMDLRLAARTVAEGAMLAETAR